MSKTGRRLRHLPGVATAWEDGLLSSAQIDAIVANLTDRTTPLFAEGEQAMVLTLIGQGARQTAHIMRGWAVHADALLGPDGSTGDTPPEPGRQLFVSSTFSGRGEITGHLDEESTDVVRTALRLAERDDDSIAHLLCDCVIHRVIRDGTSAVLDFGRSTRTISPSCTPLSCCATAAARSKAATSLPTAAKATTSNTGPTAATPTSPTSSIISTTSTANKRGERVDQNRPTNTVASSCWSERDDEGGP